MLVANSELMPFGTHADRQSKTRAHEAHVCRSFFLVHRATGPARRDCLNRRKRCRMTRLKSCQGLSLSCVATLAESRSTWSDRLVHLAGRMVFPHGHVALRSKTGPDRVWLTDERRTVHAACSYMDDVPPLPASRAGVCWRCQTSVGNGRIGFDFTQLQS